MEIEAGCRELSLGPMLTLFGATDRLPRGDLRRLQASEYLYGYDRLESVADPEATDEGVQRAVFVFVPAPEPR